MTKVTTLKKENQLSHIIRVETEKSTFDIPVLDVRDGLPARSRANAILKARNYRTGSRFMASSFSVNGNCYQNSFKK